MKKENASPFYGDARPKLKKLLIIMKLTAMFLIVVCMHASATGFSQGDISVSYKNIELKKLFNIIQKNTSYRFLYEDEQLPKIKLDVNFNRVSIQQVLDIVLNNTPLRYRILNNNLVVLTRTHEAPQQIVRGKITDEMGNPLSGVSVYIKNTSSGVFTNEAGEFSIEAPANSTLQVSYIGYLTQEVTVTSESNLSIRLVLADKNLQDVVVVGYSTQRRVNLTGAVDAVTSRQIENRPLMNLGAGLQGLIPNLNISVPNGRATTAPSFNIRGYTSINGGEPMILVDNIPFTSAEASRLNPSDIESVTVLKDASSAAIYGSRAAFGVVLINTKSAKSKKLNVSVNANVAYRTIGKMPELVTDPFLVMKYKHDAAYPLYELYDEATRVYAKQRSEDPSLPAVIINPNDPDYWAYYGSTDWISEAYKKTAPSYTTNLSISKKAENLSYYLSGEYYQQDGLLRYGNDIYKRYNVRGKVDIEASRWLTLSNNTMMTSTNYNAPVFMDELFFWNINRTNPLDVPKNPDGSWTFAGADVLGRMQSGGRAKTDLNDVQTTFSMKASIVKDVWELKGDATFRRASSLKRSSDHGIPFKVGPNLPVEYTTLNSYAERTDFDTRYNVYNIYTDVHKQLGNHYVQGLLGFNQEYRQEVVSTVRKNNLISTSFPTVNLGTGSVNGPTEFITEWAVQGLFYRLNYNFKDRYLVELNGRYDGSSRFPRNDKWGFFPSASAGWIVSEEPFVQNLKKDIRLSNLKLRASYGSLGNQTSIGAYDYLPTMPAGRINQFIDNQLPIGVYAPREVAASLTWEKVSTLNFGVDASFFNNRLELNFDKYTRDTKGMLVASRPLPAVFGAPAPQENGADLETKGWELRLNWRDNGKIAGSPFYYSVALALADNRAVITKYENPTKTLNNYYTGQEIGEIWGLEFEGFFESEQDIADHADQTPVGTDDQGFEYYVGDIKFRDRNKDGAVDFGEYTVDNPGDLQKMGNSSIRLPYSIDLAAGWKGFDARVFIQGIGKRDWYPGASNIYFWGIYAQPWTNVTVQNLDHWTPDNPNGYFPATRAYIAEDRMSEITIPNQRYMQNASYWRVKNVTLGYTLPRGLSSRIKLEKLRFYVSAENIFEKSHLKVKLDPEVGLAEEPDQRRGTIYPFQRTYSAGLNLNF